MSSARSAHAVSVDLIAVLAAVTAGAPRVMTLKDGRALPSGPFGLEHRSLQSGLRAWVEEKTQHPLGYVEQLYTFADKDRAGSESPQRTISISYLGLTRALDDAEAGWISWYDYFPWEDHRTGAPALIETLIAPALEQWVKATRSPGMRDIRRQRAEVTFGLGEHLWNEELTLQRYELLYEAGLVCESHRHDAAEEDGLRDAKTPSGSRQNGNAPLIAGLDMIADHRRILATGIARLRAKIKYRPVVFELMPPTFTLLQLQRCVEALAGRTVHKQNFRRLMEAQELVEETGETTSETIGRPAKLFRFRHSVVTERALSGSKLPLARA